MLLDSKWVIAICRVHLECGAVFLIFSWLICRDAHVVVCITDVVIHIVILG